MNPIEVPIAHEERFAGRSKYSLYSLIRLNFDLITGFSVVPLQLFSMVGMAMSLLSALLVVYLFVRRLIVGSEAEGLFTLFGLVFFFIGLALFGIGLFGEYVGRIYAQVRERPRYIVEAVLEQDGEGVPTARRSAPPGVGGDPRGGVCLQRGRGSLCARAAWRRVWRSAALHPCGRSRREPVVRQRGELGDAQGFGWRRRTIPIPSSGSPRAGARGRISVLLLLSPHARCRVAGDAAARRAQHARLAAAEVSRPRAGALGIIHGETATGASLHYMVEKPDAGALVDQQSVPILENDTALEVSIKVAEAAQQVLARSLPKLIAGSAGAAARSCAGLLFRPAPSGRRAHRLAAGRARHSRSGARGGAAVSGRLYRGERV